MYSLFTSIVVSFCLACTFKDQKKSFRGDWKVGSSPVRKTERLVG